MVFSRVLKLPLCVFIDQQADRWRGTVPILNFLRLKTTLSAISPAYV